ncbi:alpha/beta hydrolase [Planobispora longispora]|uniref:alpha/beta hydrolase n=1 Tax=Planobispora longispora TaxID=28887 RepID=UPI0019456FBB|nr:alpha/beta hydrolase [Planobispora longispora]
MSGPTGRPAGTRPAPASRRGRFSSSLASRRRRVLSSLVSRRRRFSSSLASRHGHLLPLHAHLRGRVLSAVLLAAATSSVGLCALAVLGAFLHEVPYLDLAGAPVSSARRFVVALSAGGSLALCLWLRRRSRLTAAVLGLAVLTATGASVITARMTAAVERAGADISLVQSLVHVVGGGSATPSAPDAEAAYSTYQGRPLKLSVYRPAGSTTASRAPVLLYVHGGGWVAGSRADRSDDMRWFADRGWLTISLDYGLSAEDRHLWDVVHGQIGCALAWVARNAHRYGGDAARLSLTGDSAGGNLAVNTAYMAGNKTLRASCAGPVPAVAAVSVLYPVLDPAGFHRNDDPASGEAARRMAEAYTGGSPREFPQRYAAVSAFSHLSGAAPATLVIVGEADRLVPPEGAYRFAEQARARGVDVELVRVPHAGHVFDGPAGSIGRQAYRQLTAAWLRDRGQAP